MDRIFITGASGFVGKNLLKLYPHAHAIPHEQIETFKLPDFDKFFFLSSYGNMAYQTDDDETIKANVLNLIHIIRQAVKYPFKSFVYMSTSSVKLDIQTMYSRSKHASEEILLSYIEKYHLPILIIRPYSITGVGEQSRHLIPTLIRSAFGNEKIDFSPYATHDFIDVSDVVAGIDNLSSNSLRGIYELGTGACYYNQQVLNLVEKITRKKVKVKSRKDNIRRYDQLDWHCKNYKARSYGWLPKKTLEDSITEMVKYELSQQA